MKPFQRLSLIIIVSSLLPTFAVVWSRCNESRESAEDKIAMAELRLTVKALIIDRAAEPEKGDEYVEAKLSRWLSDHPGHPCAALIREPLRRMREEHPNLRPYHCGAVEAAARAIVGADTPP